MRGVAVFASACAVVALAGAGRSGAEPPLLVGTVGPGFTIVLADATGARVSWLAPGAYTLLVHDLSPGHNFHLIGAGGVDEIVTTPEFVGDRSITVTLADGIYGYQCDPHVGEMSGGFTVGAATSVTTPLVKTPVVKKQLPKKKLPKKKPAKKKH